MYGNRINWFDLFSDESVEEGRSDEEADASVQQGAQDAVEVDQRRRVNQLPLKEIAICHVISRSRTARESRNEESPTVNVPITLNLT